MEVGLWSWGGVRWGWRGRGADGDEVEAPWAILCADPYAGRGFGPACAWLLADRVGERRRRPATPASGLTVEGERREADAACPDIVGHCAAGLEREEC